MQDKTQVHLPVDGGPQMQAQPLSVRVLPQQAERVETGPVQFGDDWPGVFIRGDNAFGFVGALDAFMREPSNPFAWAIVQGLRETLAASDLTGLSRDAAAEPRVPPDYAALRASHDALRDALTDMLAGWRYIRSFHGDLYGVGWDRCEESATAALAKARTE